MKRKQFFALLLSAAVTLQPAAVSFRAEEPQTEANSAEVAEQPEDAEKEPGEPESSEEEEAAPENEASPAQENDPEGEQNAQSGSDEASEQEAPPASQEENTAQDQSSQQQEESAESEEAAVGEENAAQEETAAPEERAAQEETGEPETQAAQQEPDASSEAAAAEEQAAQAETASQEGQAVHDTEASQEANADQAASSDGSSADPAETADPKSAKKSDSKSGKKHAPETEENRLSEEELEQAAAENFLKVTSSKVKLSGDKAEVTLFTNQKEYNIITFDDPDEDDPERIEGTIPSADAAQDGDTGDTEKTEDTDDSKEGYCFVFEVPAGELGTIVPYHACKTDGSWYTEHALYMKLPIAASEEDEETNGASEQAAALFLTAEDAERTDSKEPGETIVTEDDIALFLSADAASEAAFDNSTDLEDGTYTIAASDFTWEGGTGKAHLTCSKVTIKDGKATAQFVASSSSMTHAYCGYAPGNDETNALYNPKTGALGTNVYEISNKSVTLPVRLNEETDLACRTIAMSDPHWVRYTYTIKLDAPKAETESSKQSETTKPDETESSKQSETTKADESESSQQTETSKSNETDSSKQSESDKQTEQTSETSGTKTPAKTKNQIAAEKAQAKMDALPDAKKVTLGDQKAIQAARKAYDKLTAKQKKLVAASSLKRLTKAEAALKELQENPLSIKNGKLTQDGVYSVAYVELAEGYKMFNVIACTLTVKDGTMTAVITLHGTGLDYMYAGKAKKAEKADQSDWIPYKEDAEGQFTFEIPVKKLDTVLVYAARSKRYAQMAEAGETVTVPLWYDKGLIFHSDSITRADQKGETNADDPESESNKDSNKDKDGKDGSGKSQGSDKNGGSGSTGSGNTGGGSTGGGSTGGGSTGGGSTGGADNSGYAANTDGSTGAVDSSSALADGTYSPDSFTWSGGTGKLSISCSEITVSGGKAYATLVFSSGKIVYVKADGGQLQPVSQDDGSSTYRVPVQLNANNTILACTTAMSQPHEVSYTIYVGLEAAKKAASAKGGSAAGSSSGGGAKGSAGTASASAKGAGSSAGSEDKDAGAGTFRTESGLTLRVEEKAPSVPGADYVGTLVTEHAKQFRVHYYDKDIRLVEITLSDSSDSEEVNWDPKDPSNQETIKEDESAGKPDSSAETQNAGAGADEEGSGSDVQEASLYESRVLQYLLVPEEADIPAGIEKQMNVLRMPVKRAFIDSETAWKIAQKLGAPSQEGTLGKSAYKELLRSGADVVIVSSKELLQSAEDESQTGAKEHNAAQAEELHAAAQQYGEMLSLLEIPMLVDRADEEQEELGTYEWLLLYGALFDCEADAQKAYEAARKALEPASSQERTEG